MDTWTSTVPKICLATSYLSCSLNSLPVLSSKVIWNVAWLWNRQLTIKQLQWKSNNTVLCSLSKGNKTEMVTMLGFDSFQTTCSLAAIEEASTNICFVYPCQFGAALPYPVPAALPSGLTPAPPLPSHPSWSKIFKRKNVNFCFWKTAKK